MNLTDLLAGKKVLEEIDSPINGKLQVIRDLAWGTYIQGGGLTQSGGILEKIWKNTLKEVRESEAGIYDILILGLGGGSLGKILREKYPDSKITGVDLDPIMIDLGEKYLKLGEFNVIKVIEDAMKFLSKKNNKYDLICVDLYVGEEFPKKFSGDKFIKSVKESLDEDGVAIFNRTYYGDKRKQAKLFGEKLENHFKDVKWFYPEANLMFICND